MFLLLISVKPQRLTLCGVQELSGGVVVLAQVLLWMLKNINIGLLLLKFCFALCVCF